MVVLRKLRRQRRSFEATIHHPVTSPVTCTYEVQSHADSKQEVCTGQTLVRGRDRGCPYINTVHSSALCVQKVLHDDLLKEDAQKRDPNSDEQLGVVRDTYTREITRGPMDGAA